MNFHVCASVLTGPRRDVAGPGQGHGTEDVGQGQETDIEGQGKELVFQSLIVKKVEDVGSK